MATKTSLDDPRIRFNSGFWDGVYDARNGQRDRRSIAAGELFCLPTFDRHCKPYRVGYGAGFDSYRADPAIYPNGTSESAWRAWRAS